MKRLITLGQVAASLAAIAFVTLIFVQLLPANPTTVALTYLVVVLLVATAWGIAESTTASIAAVFCFNFFFLPPVGTLTIADPQNWVALVAFLLTATVASQLSGRARQRHVEALARERDLERLYALSRAMLLSEHTASIPGDIARHIASSFELPTVGVYDQRTERAAWAGTKETPAIDVKLREVARRSASQRDPSGLTLVAIQLGGAPIGSMAVPDLELSDTVLQSIANLAAIGLERARSAETTARAEAARASSELRATVLDALAHEFKTPLTVMKAASSDLVASAPASGRDRELLGILDEELDRLNSLVSDAIQMLRIDAGDFAVRPERHLLGSIVAVAVKKLERRLDGHELIARVPPEMTVEADRDLLGLAIRQLLDNALKYSPPSSKIEILAKADGDIGIAVHNSGSTIPEREQARIFERFYRGSQARHIPGTGMGLSIVQQIARAHGGELRVSSSADAGTTFVLSLPREGARAK